MAVYESKVPTVLLPTRLNFSTKWEVFGPVSLQGTYNKIVKLLEHLKEDVANAPEWDADVFDDVLTAMQDDVLYPGLQENIAEVLLALVDYNAAQKLVIDDLETRVSALENP